MVSVHQELARTSVTRHRNRNDVYRHLFLLVVGVLVLFPYLLMLMWSFKDFNQFDHNQWVPTWPLHVDNFFGRTGAFFTIWRFILNTIFIAAVSAVGAVSVAALTAHVFARFSFPGKETLFFLVIALLMIPGILTLVPQFILIRGLGLFNTPWALIVPYISGGQVFAIFILRQFFAAIPEELFEAARTDGASEARAFLMISVPLSQSILGVVTIMHVLHSWNDLIWPLVTLTSQSNFTLTLGLFAFRNENWTNWGPLFAGYVIASIPLLILFALTSRLFVEGLASGALKL
ncbi:MAG TPA: carbohydrate ABC transporter permease [Chloroflexota bacterium]|jgi:multiple sugar transport system permease protein/raffinose/stachyose/melibiose transport system permease protein|nr:carbohydrate ABC transporter permease [Chloroflexota bacterium]